MEVRRYEKTDFWQIHAWGKQYGADYAEEQFPETGFIVDGVAAYFLYKTDSSVCFLENMIANRKVDLIDKNAAIELIVPAILKEARDLGFTVAYATTNIPSVVFRAIQNGAAAQAKHTLLAKKLTDPS